MSRVGRVLLLLVLVAGTAIPAVAQLPPGLSLALEVRPTAGVPVGGFASEDEGVAAGAGVGFGAGGVLGIGPVGVYGEYQYLRFACGDCEPLGLDDSAVDAGWEAGVEVRAPFRPLGFESWARAGLVGHQLEFTSPEGSMVSEPALGWGVGGGVTLPLPVGVTLAPGVRFRSYRADYQFPQLGIEGAGTDVSYLAFSVGVRYRF